MKKYIAIGHWVENKENTTSVAMETTSIKSFRETLAGNTFVPYVIITEKKLEVLRKATADFELFEEVKKMTTNYRKWNEITDYIDQCFDIMEERLEQA